MTLSNAVQLYNSTSYLDDLMLASAWLAVVSGRPAYAAEAETYWKRIVSGSNKSWQSLVADWNNQWWAGNVILAGLTGNHSYQVTLTHQQKTHGPRTLMRAMLWYPAHACGL